MYVHTFSEPHLNTPTRREKNSHFSFDYKTEARHNFIQTIRERFKTKPFCKMSTKGSPRARYNEKNAIANGTRAVCDAK